MPPPRRVLIVGTQRSGTSVTHACLSGHPQVAIASDEIHAAFFSSAPPGGGDEQLFLDTFDFVAGERTGAAVRAIKTALPSAAHARQLVACMATHGRSIDLVIVRRCDLVAQLGSLHLAQQTGTWHRRDEGTAAATPIAFTRGEVERYVGEHVATHACIDRLRDGRRVLDLDYEQHIATGAAWALLFRFLGIDELRPDWLRMHKRSPRPQEFIRDYAEWSSQLPAIVDAARASATVPESKRIVPARVFLLHRARLHLQRGRPALAAVDALASLAAPADWGVEQFQWACDTLGEALHALGDAACARDVASALAARHPRDEHVQALVERVRTVLAGA